MQTAVKERVLVVDDEPQVLVALEDVLGDDFSVTAVESGEAALDLLARERNIAVVITDQRMPRMKGDELLIKMKHTTRAASILLTGFADLTAVIRAVNEGHIFAYVTKPWDAPDLRLKVGKAAEHFRLLRSLAAESQLIHDLMDSTTDLVFFKDLSLRYLRVNHAFAGHLNRTPESIVGKRVSELIDAELGAQVEAQELDVIRRGRTDSDRLRHVTIGAVEHWFSTTTAPVRDGDGEIVGLVGIAREVTDRIVASEALRASERRFRDQSALLGSILDSMGEGVVATDSSSHFVMFNRSAEAVLGRVAPETPPSNWADAFGLFLPDRQTPMPVADNPLVRAIGGEETKNREIFVKNKLVPGATIAVTAGPLLDDAGTSVGGIALLRDVTLERRLEQQLAQSQKMEAMGLLAGGVAHDFNNMLSVITSYSDLIYQALRPDDPIREDVNEVLEAARRAAALTRQLLAFSRRQVAERKAIDLSSLVSESEKMLKRILGEHIDLKTLPGAMLGSVYADESQIEQIILNLTVNARDAMPDGGRLTIETENVTVSEEYAEEHPGARAGEYVMLAVTDTGIGIDAETKRRIFEPFFTTKPVGQGTGLGLSTVYGIVNQSGGYIEVYSEVGIGTAFKIYLPRVDAPSAHSVRERLSARRISDHATILLVEDDDAVRRVALRILRQCGYEVLETQTASDARRLCEERSDEIDLLLTDVVMPEISGPKLADELRVSCKRLRTLFMSGYPSGAATRGTLLEMGAPFLSKPFTPAGLVDKVREVLESRRASHARHRQ